MPLRFLLFSITLALIGVLPIDARPARAAVTEVDHGHEISFGSSILVWATVESDEPISEARFVYKPEGTGRISTYSYATITTSTGGSRFEALIPTSGSAYLPPGTRLQVRFELTLADGSAATIGPFPITYLDPGRDWTRLQRPGLPVELVYYGLNENASQALLTEAANRLNGITDALGVEYDSLPEWVAVVYPGIDEFTAVFPPTSQAATDNRLFGGFAMGEYHLLVQVSPSPRRFVHELTHLVIYHATSSPLAAPVPSWLHEGLAGYFETGSSASADQFIRQTAPGSIQRFSAMNNMPGRGEDIAVFYPQAASFVGYLIREHGNDRMAALLSAINDGQRVAVAFETAYGRSLTDEENRWRISLGLPAVLPSESEANETPAPVPATPAPTVVTEPTSEASPEASPGAGTTSQSVLIVSLLMGSAMIGAAVWLISVRLRQRRQ